MAKLLGIDFGLKRTGIAITDDIISSFDKIFKSATSTFKVQLSK